MQPTTVRNRVTALPDTCRRRVAPTCCDLLCAPTVAASSDGCGGVAPERDPLQAHAPPPRGCPPDGGTRSAGTHHLRCSARIFCPCTSANAAGHRHPCARCSSTR